MNNSSTYDYSRLSKVKLVRHESVKSVLSAYYEEPEDNVFELKIKADLTDGSSMNMSVADEASAIEKMGLWGFALIEANEIHFWMGKQKDIKDLTFFVAHELGHLTGKEDSDDLQEEMRADSYAYVAIKAMELAESIKI